MVGNNEEEESGAGSRMRQSCYEDGDMVEHVKGIVELAVKRNERLNRVGC